MLLGGHHVTVTEICSP